MNISQGRRLWELVLYKYCDLVVFFSAYIYIYIYMLPRFSVYTR